MAQVILKDGRFFDTQGEGVKRYEESADWDGSNFVSRATACAHNHQYLYRTKTGVWVLNCWSNYANVREVYEEIPEKEAHEWLLKHGHHDAVPEAMVAAHAI